MNIFLIGVFFFNKFTEYIQNKELNDLRLLKQANLLIKWTTAWWALH